MKTCITLRWKAFLNMTKPNCKKNDKVDHKKFTILSRRKKIHKIKTQTALWEKNLHHMVCDKQWFLSKQ